MFINVLSCRKLAKSLGKHIGKDALVEIDKRVESIIYRAKANAGGMKTIKAVDVRLTKDK